MLALRLSRAPAASRARVLSTTTISRALSASAPVCASASASTFAGASTTSRPPKRRRGGAERAAAYERARRLASALKLDEEDGSRGPRPSAAAWPALHGAASSAEAVAGSPASKSAAASGLEEPALKDLLALRPKMTPMPLKPSYASRHASVVTAVDKAFVRSQLLAFAREMGIVVDFRDRKGRILQSILDQWGWVLPGSLTRDRMTMEFPISSGDLFLLQRDPGLSPWLASAEVSLRVETPQEGAGSAIHNLVAGGSRDALQAFSRLLSGRQCVTVGVQWSVSEMGGWAPSTATMWAVSTTTGAYVHPSGDGYAAQAISIDDARRARNMILRAARVATEPPNALVAASPTDHASDSYTLTAHLPAPSSPLPWETAAVVRERHLFRLTRVQGETPADREFEHRDEKMGGARVLPVGKSAQEGEALTGALDDVVARTRGQVVVPEGEGQEQSSIVFSFGHFLTPAEGQSLLSPLPGAWPLDTAVWGNLGPVFSPAVPPALIRFPIPGAPRRYRRVTYRGGEQTLVAEYAYPAPEAPAKASTPTTSGGEEPAWIHRLNAMLDAHPTVDAERPSDDIVFDMGGLRSLIEDEPSPAPSASVPVSAHLAAEASSDVLLPARPTDARLTARATRALHVPELDDFFGRVHANAGYASTTPLGDLDALRRGTPPPQPQTAAEPEPEPELSEEDAWVADIAAEDVPPDVRPGTPNAIPPAPAPPLPEPTLSPPSSIRINGTLYVLDRDEVLDITESVVTPPTEADASPAAPSQTSSSPSPARIVLRTIAATDLTGPGGVTRAAELEAPSPAADETVWRELASVTREVPPGVRAQRRVW